MTAHVLITGTLFRAPEQRTSKAGKPFVTATLKAKDGDEPVSRCTPQTRQFRSPPAKSFSTEQSAGRFSPTLGQAPRVRLSSAWSLACRGRKSFELANMNIGIQIRSI
jgi:hypothetical protein